MVEGGRWREARWRKEGGGRREEGGGRQVEGEECSPHPKGSRGGVAGHSYCLPPPPGMVRGSTVHRGGQGDILFWRRLID